MTYFRFFGIVRVFYFGLFFLYLPFSAGQDVPTVLAVENASEFEHVEPLKIMVSVKEVRIDVVVLDKKGEPITDLTTADFEVFQDDRRQAITSSVYVDSPSDVAAGPSATRKDVPNLPLLPSVALKKEDVRRTIVFVVDDAAMSFENGQYTKMALRNFVEKQMQPGDLVSILRTDYGNRALNMFLSDKREVLARVNAIPTTMLMSPSFRNWGLPETPGMREIFAEMLDNFQTRLYENQISALSYGLHALKNVPGRKFLIMVIPLSMYAERPYPTDQGTMPKSIGMLGGYEPIIRDVFSRYRDLYTRLADNALRAGVVVNLLDVDVLYNLKSNYADASESLKPMFGWMEDPVIRDMRTVRVDPIAPSIPLPALTGGITVKDSNFFLDGVGKEVESLMKGYYLISYVPPPNTFEKRNKKDNEYRRLKINVKRSGAKVYTRDGFFGRLEYEPDADTPKNPLMEAIYSPFKQDGININMAAGYVKDAKAGYLVRSWIHLDPKDVNIIETEEGGNRIDLEAVVLTSDINGNIQDSQRVEFTVSNVNVDWVHKHGIRFSMLLPVKKPGSYYVRIAVKDKESDKAGSAYQFLEIPDTGKKGKALSNIFMITSADDLNWLRSDVKNEIGKGVFFPMVQGEDVRSPALRTYKPGDNLMTVVMLYNADEKAIARSEIETQTILYKDGKEFLRGAPAAITPDKVDNPDSIMLVNRFIIDSAMTPGDYILQILASDKKNRGNEGAASSQFLGFTVIEP